MSKITSLSTAGILAVSMVSMIPTTASATTLNTYQHATYAQSHYTTLAKCNTARTSSIALLKKNKASYIVAGVCHPYQMTINNKAVTGYMFNETYKRTRPLWYGDKTLGTTPTAMTGASSFKEIRFGFSSKTSAQQSQQALATTIKANKLYKVTSLLPVTQNTVTNKWEYEVDYSSRYAWTSRDIQISEKYGVTSVSQGITKTPTSIVPNGGTSMGDTSIPSQVVKSTPTTVVAKTGTTTSTTTTSTTGTVTQTTTTPTTTTSTTVGISGIDVSSHNTSVDFVGLKSQGVQFAYVKATEGTYYTNPLFSSQYTAASNAGMKRGGYTFIKPNSSTGIQAADYFIAHGGAWTNDGNTLPGAIDAEWNPYVSTDGTNSCYGLDQPTMATWLQSFVTEYKAKEGINPVIYTATSWWNTCVGTSGTSLSQSPLWLARYNTTVGAMPTTWANTTQTIWQNSDGGSTGLDTDIFNGTLAQLNKFATTGSMS